MGPCQDNGECQEMCDEYYEPGEYYGLCSMPVSSAVERMRLSVSSAPGTARSAQASASLTA